MRFSELARHAVWLVPTEREKIRRFINVLNQQFRFIMTLGNIAGAKFDEVVDSARWLEMVRNQEREQREAKRSRSPDCHTKTVTLAKRGLPKVEWRGSPNYVPSRVISYLKAQRIVGKGYLSYLSFMRDVDSDTPTIDSVLVMRDFSDVFPADLLGMPPDMDIDFGIDLVPGTEPISIPLYHMTPAELKELKEQQELLDKGSIRPSVSPWGAPV
ncbi:uncharacterized protein [Nicotiana tomentosiformis]|uniref:uncharacterized protein n=1 Tax=Nicotiana tomentosiformis TaxID=4098 RepID=UPI00388CB4B7